MSFKMKYHGHKLTVRKQEPSEKINDKSLWCYVGEGVQNNNEEFYSNLKGPWLPSKCVGEMVGDHPARAYVEVTSPFYVGESTSEHTEL